MSAPDKLPEPDLSGRTLERYHLLRRLGVGGMGAVYEAEHTRLRKRFAVKLLRHELATNEISRKRFLREARAASAVNHPHVVAISDFGETDDGQVFFVMELLEGKDLHDVLETERVLPWPRTREILLQVTAALQAAHLQDIIHRDIKPSNVFLADVPGKGDEDFVKVLDFGIAKLSGSMGDATGKLTSTDEIFGTVAYMAPEMAIGKSDDPRSDMYAVGVMMYRMLTGELPYTEGNAFQILSQHVTAPIPAPRTKDPSIPEAVEAIVMRAMAKQPEDRFSTMEEFNRVLRRGMIEATEVLVGARAALQAAAMREPLPDRPGPDIDKTTPLPVRAPSTEPPPRTEIASPLPRPSPLASSESGVGIDQAVATGDSGAITRDAPSIGDSGAMSPGLADSAAIPRYEQTVASTPIVLQPSGPMQALSTDAAVEPAMPQPPEPTVTLDSGSMGSLADEGVVLAEAPVRVEHDAVDEHDVIDEHDAVDDRDEPRRSAMRWVLPLVGAAAVLGVVGFFMMNGGGNESDAKAPPARIAAASPSSADAKSKPVVEPSVTPDSSGPKVEPPVKPDPRPAEPAPTEPPPSDDGAQPVEPEPVVEPDETSKTTRPKGEKPKPKPKPRTDQQVVADLKAKIIAKCKDQLGGKVRVEGSINPAGKVEGLFVTPPDGLGECEKLVKAAKFDPRGGVRPMPRFSVEP